MAVWNCRGNLTRVFFVGQLDRSNGQSPSSDSCGVTVFGALVGSKFTYWQAGAADWTSTGSACARLLRPWQLGVVLSIVLALQPPTTAARTDGPQ